MYPFFYCRFSVHKSLCDNVDTKSALDAIRESISEANKYMNSSSEVRINRRKYKDLFYFKIKSWFC